MTVRYPNLAAALNGAIDRLRYDGQVVDTGHWQGYDTTGHPDLVTSEIINLAFEAPIPETRESLEASCAPSIPWAETEFQERVGGEPHNPHHSLEQWPWWNGQIETPFSHTYSERFWPRQAGAHFSGEDLRNRGVEHRGIRYRYGDLQDVLTLLRKHPQTRQATFPIFFPEDTGAVHGGRIPCTLHYHFLLRNDRLHLWYPIRSCDAVRHFRDDIYMAGRLCQWVLEQLQYEDGETHESSPWALVKPGNLYFTAYSFHVHAGDKHLL